MLFLECCQTDFAEEDEGDVSRASCSVSEAGFACVDLSGGKDATIMSYAEGAKSINEASS